MIFGCQRLLKAAFFVVLLELAACGGAGSQKSGVSGPDSDQSPVDSQAGDPDASDSDAGLPTGGGVGNSNTSIDASSDISNNAVQVASQGPFVFDWSTFSDASIESESLITPASHAYYNEVDWRTVLQSQHLSGEPVALMLRNSTAPYGGERWYTLNDVLAYLNDASIPLDFVFSDFESETEVEDTLAMLSQLNENEAPHPSRDDVRALVQHLRLRGINGYYSWSHGGNRHYPVENDDSASRRGFRDDVVDAWSQLDSSFAGAPQVFLDPQSHRRISFSANQGLLIIESH